MTEPTGHECPECGAPRGADNTPSCGCTQRASDALRDARTAEAAAAEDFDPLRIRPYVELAGEDGVGKEVPSALPAEETVTSPAEETVPLQAVDATSLLPPVPPVPPSGEEPPDYGDEAEEDAGPVRRRRTVLLAAGGAVVAVVAATGLASGFLSYQTPSRDNAASGGVRASVPDASSATASVSPAQETGSPSPTSAPPSPSASTSPTPSTSPSATAVSPTPTRSTEPTGTPSTVGATGTIQEGGADSSTPPVLRRGDHGAEVVELQERLGQLNLYVGKHDGDFSTTVESSVRTFQLARGISADESGVYGAATRAKLESETTEP
ncbi:peptidoglycan-binding protein [Streptomyces sp. NPDC092369]|uniref:peptidoglycan-binding domain-containing protein n=1 Tax=Streptomyces sp. NPDC092369 TaxID=3366015 RepID=UPI00382430F7